MKLSTVIVAVAALLTPGCILSSMSRPDNLTPEQIKAYNESGFDVYGCFQLAGPPPAGGLTYFVVPKGKQLTVGWANNCQPLNAGVK